MQKKYLPEQETIDQDDALFSSLGSGFSQLYGNGAMQGLLQSEGPGKGLDGSKGAGGSAKEANYTTSNSGTATTYTPKNNGNGHTIYFFFGYTTYTKKDQKMKDKEDDHLSDDIQASVDAGFTVVNDTAGTKASFLAAVYSASTYGIYWSGHGYSDGSIQTSDGGQVFAHDIDTSQVGGNCQFLILATCNSAKAQADWQKAMGGQCKFQGWVKTTTVGQTNDFTTSRPLDKWFSHKGTDPNMELDDYIQLASDRARQNAQQEPATCPI